MLGVTMHAKHNHLTVLHIATLNKPIRSDLGYGPVETIVDNIHKGIQSLGHRSIVACSADSRIAGEGYVTVHRSLGDYWVEDTAERRNVIVRHLALAGERAARGDIDVIQMHEWLDYICEDTFSPPLPIVMTLHVPADESGIAEAQQRWSCALAKPSVHFVAISDYQERQYSNFVTPCATIHHGIDVDDFPCKEKPNHDSYLFMIGRVARVKGQDKAIELAIHTRSKLIIAGCVQNKPADREFFDSLKGRIDLCVGVGKHPVEKDYYERVMKPLLHCDQQIIYVGELSNEQKKQWYRHARATLFPVQWGEPFGLVMIESLACGTPILAFREGAVPEIIVDGKTGFVVDSLPAMTRALARIDGIDPRACRSDVEHRFSITRMAKAYAEVYQEVVSDYHDTETTAGYRQDHCVAIGRPL